MIWLRDVAAGLFGGATSGLRLLGGDAGNACQPVRVVDDRAGLEDVVLVVDPVPWRFPQRHPARAVDGHAVVAHGGRWRVGFCRPDRAAGVHLAVGSRAANWDSPGGQHPVCGPHA